MTMIIFTRVGFADDPRLNQLNRSKDFMLKTLLCSTPPDHGLIPCSDQFAQIKFGSSPRIQSTAPRGRRETPWSPMSINLLTHGRHEVDKQDRTTADIGSRFSDAKCGEGHALVDSIALGYVSPESTKSTVPLTTSFLPLDLELRFSVDTATAAHYLNRRPQTLRSWASRENGATRPIRINGRLAWPMSEIRRLLGCSAIKSGDR